MLKVLVTGGAGLIGSNIVKRFSSLGHDVHVADNLWRGKLENLYKNGHPVIDLDSHFHQVDLQNYDNCIAVSKNVDVVIHLADIVAGINFINSSLIFPITTTTLVLEKPLRILSLRGPEGITLLLPNSCSSFITIIEKSF